ncbi:MAG TPA: glycosyltransferase family 2 protein [Candidatus Latescibacteria bacterium]|nr:glycosyltransferase family 2 protein [Candidatus Latescibacterota bacterium]
MYRNQKIGLSIPAYNEERLIGPTLDSIPDFVDVVYVVNDCSQDDTAKIIGERAVNDPRIVLVSHEQNQGVGQAIITGYLRASESGCDICVVTGGDHQMPMEQIPQLLDPIVDGAADYSKGNRFLMPDDGLEDMPMTRMLPNAMISFMTKMASGYYKIFDVVDGFTAISKRAIDLVDWDIAWKGYGYPMDFLVRMNAYGLRVVDVPRRAIYLEGERQSQIKGFPYLVKVSGMLVRDFFWRLFTRYLIRDFHPLFFFYFFGLLFLPMGVIYGGFLIYQQIAGIGVSGPRSVVCALMIMMGLQFLLFAMLYDMEESK